MYLVSTYHKSSSYKQLHCLQPLLPNCVHLSYCSPIVSASAVVPQLCPLQLLFPNCICINCCSPIASSSQLLLLNCICFSCCSPVVSASAAASRLHLHQLLLPDYVHFSTAHQLHQLVTSVQSIVRARVTLYWCSPTPEHPTFVTHMCTHA